MLWHQEPSQSSCPYCQKLVKVKRFPTKHKKRTHRSERSVKKRQGHYACEKCGKEYSHRPRILKPLCHRHDAGVANCNIVQHKNGEKQDKKHMRSHYKPQPEGNSHEKGRLQVLIAQKSLIWHLPEKQSINLKTPIYKLKLMI